MSQAPQEQHAVYVVVALSQRKQSQIMNTVGKAHSEDQPFPTWSLVGQALSEALFNGQGHLRLKSTMEMHRKDCLLFERIVEGRCMSKSSTAPVIEYILEIDFGRQLDCLTWLGYWKIARPVVEKLVRNSIISLAKLGESIHPQLDGESGGIEGQEMMDEKDNLLEKPC